MQEIKFMRRTEPSRSLLDKEFQYVPASKTDIRETFKKIKERTIASYEQKVK